MAKKKGEVSTFEPKNTKSGKKRPTASGLIALAVIVLVIAYFVVSGIKIIKLNQERKKQKPGSRNCFTHRRTYWLNTKTLILHNI